jgi:hypothetical protein
MITFRTGSWSVRPNTSAFSFCMFCDFRPCVRAYCSVDDATDTSM